MSMNLESLRVNFVHAPMRFWWGVFTALHIVSTLPWGDAKDVFWVLSHWMCVWSMLGVLWWACLKRPASFTSAILTSWLAYFWVAMATPEWVFEWFGAHDEALRLFLSLGLAALGGGCAIWGGLAYKSRMWVWGAVGVLLIQCIHASVFMTSFHHRQKLIQEEHAWVISHPDLHAVFAACQKRKWTCIEGEAGEPLPDIKSTSYHRVLREEAKIELKKMSEKTEAGQQVKTWSWSERWVRVPDDRWPLLVSYQKTAEGKQRLLMDTQSESVLIRDHKMYFGLMTSLGGAIWLFGAWFVSAFHKRRWDKKRSMRALQK
jgi:hypothetical protein